MAKSLDNGRDVAHDSVTGEEISSTTIPPSTPSESQVTELLSPSKKKPSAKPNPEPFAQKPPVLKTFTGREGLGAYAHAPDTFPTSRVISYNADYVTINDLYPKSSIHLLLLPRNPEKHRLHPFEALQDKAFLASIQEEVRKLRLLVAKELQRRYGKFSGKDRRREEAIEKALETGEEIDEGSLPSGRDWSKDVISGIHTHPSMSHLHIHVLSIDRHSECMRHRKHYNSFATPFLVDVDEFPLTADDMRRRRKERYLEKDLVCWRCGRNFGNKFARLKQHLEEEFEEWKKEATIREPAIAEGLKDDLGILGQQPSLQLYTQLCFCFTTTDTSSRSAIIDTLKVGLERLSASFSWVAGQIVNEGSREGNSGHFSIKAFESIPRLVIKELQNDLSMDELRNANFPAIMLNEVVIAPCKTIPRSSDDLVSGSALVFLLQANFISGGLLLTFNGQHQAMDMVGQARIIQLFSKACRKEPFTVDACTAVDVRRYLDIPKTYPGLVQNMRYHTYTLQQLAEEPLGSVASKLRLAVDPTTSTVEYDTRALATFLDRTSDKNIVNVVATVDPSTDIMLSSWANLDCYELDFGLGLGKPEAVRRLRFDPVEGLIYLMPKTLNGEIAVAICLRDEDMDRLITDVEFAKYGEYIG
ncbi:MAG: hypothetical protein Q9181_005832 [Wetmoreana brouardii]